MTSFLFNSPNGEIEVVCTGRYAVKKSLTSKNIYKKIEITPVDEHVGWKKFVNEEDLLEIKRFNDFESID
jgi:hypothetical protein